ncbi:MAG: PLP-dependent aspartate aminotransferase family protein, partial [Bacteroidota bacterium]
MKNHSQAPDTLAVHAGNHPDSEFGGVVTPLYSATAYPYLEREHFPYPRYFNIPNHDVVAKKLAALERTESALCLCSGMAAISTAFFTFLQAGDHAVFQRSVYGGTFSLITKQLERFGITYSFAEGQRVDDFAAVMRPETKLVYLETPSNPLLRITDIPGVTALAKQRGALTMADNTFASPINQTPHELGVDIVMHSATKYLGGHSDITAGMLAGKREHIEAILQTARLMGGSLAPETLVLLE